MTTPQRSSKKARSSLHSPHGLPIRPVTGELMETTGDQPRAIAVDPLRTRPTGRCSVAKALQDSEAVLASTARPKWAYRRPTMKKRSPRLGARCRRRCRRGSIRLRSSKLLCECSSCLIFLVFCANLSGLGRVTDLQPTTRSDMVMVPLSL